MTRNAGHTRPGTGPVEPSGVVPASPPDETGSGGVQGRGGVGQEATTRTTWLIERRQGVGASEVAAIRNRSPYGSPWSVWADKVGLTPLDLEPNDSMRLGTDLEPVIIEWFHRDTGYHVDRQQELVRHPQASWEFATVDGFVIDSAEPTRPLGVFESKYTADAEWDTVPDHYRSQVQWQMHVTGLDRAWLAVMHLPFGRPRFRVYVVDRDEQEIAESVGEVEAFWFDHVVTGEPPFPDNHPATTAAITAAWGGVDTVKIPTVDLDDLADTIGELADMRAQRNALKPLIEARENVVKARIGAAGELSDGTVNGDVVVSWRAQSRTDLDVAAVRADHGDRYDRTSTVRVLRLHGRALR